MASSTPFDGTSFLTGAPDEDQPHGNDFQEHQSTRKSMEFANNKEHEALASTMSATVGGGVHKNGSAKIYHGDYSTASAGDALPSVRPDGATSLDASDAGRLAFDTDATYGGIIYRWNGSAWVAIPYTHDTAATLAGKSWFLDDDTMAGDDATKVASQQSTKKYVDDRRAYIKLVDSKTSGTDGGSFTSGSWQKRTVTEEADTGNNASVSSSVIVLAAGTYECRVQCPAHDVGSHQSRLQNTTGTTTIMLGSSQFSSTTGGVNATSVIVGRFTIAAAQNLEIQHQCEATKADNGLGVKSAFGVNNIYTIAEFWKI